MAQIGTVKTENFEMDYATFGSGKKAFVILPGISIKPVVPSANGIEAMFSAFKDEYTVYVFDRKNNINDFYSIPQMADDTVFAMQKLGIEKADIYGASQGGMMAQCIAIRHPEIIDRLVTASSPTIIDDEFKNVYSKWLEYTEKRDEAGLINCFTEFVYSKESIKKFGNIIYSANANITEEEFIRFYYLLRSFDDFDIAKDLEKIKCKSLILFSKLDKVVSESTINILKEKLNCSYYIYDDHSHAVYDEAPDFVDRIYSFLTK